MPNTWISQQLQIENPTLEEVRNGATGYVLRIETDHQRYYFKACAANFAYEPKLTAALATWFPEHIPTIAAVHPEKAWFLMADAGATVRSLSQEAKNLPLWDEMLRQYAKMQQAAIPHRDELINLGVADRRLEKLPALYQQIIRDKALVGHEDGVTEADFEKLPSHLPMVEALCQKAAFYPVPETLHHDDFHTNNVGYQNGDYRFFDWCESCISHPFYSLLMMQRYAKFVFEADDTILNRLRDAYLGEWTAYAPLETLIDMLPITHQLTVLCRALTWWDISQKVDEKHRQDAQEGASYWLMTFVNNTPFS